MQILLNNAYEAWKSAIYYHDRIEKGFTTLEFQKGFVSSLHNSVELFLKQIMLDNKDHDVATLRYLRDGMGKQAEDAPAYRGAKTAYARSNDTEMEGKTWRK